jgi:dolichyl-phosphate beta-glucosyltransferase
LQMVLGSRVRLLGRRIERRAARHYLGRLFATVVSWMLGLPVYDTQCGAKLFRVSPEMRGVFERPFLSRWIFDVEILARWGQSVRARNAGWGILEIPLREWRDVPGSKLRIKDFFRAALGLVEIQRAYSRPRRSTPVAFGRERDLNASPGASEVMVKAGERA